MKLQQLVVLLRLVNDAIEACVDEVSDAELQERIDEITNYCITDLGGDGSSFDEEDWK